MSSFRTLIRAVIMISALFFVAKGWHLYGPSRQQVASTMVRAVEVADNLLGKFREPPPQSFVAAPTAMQPAPQNVPFSSVAPPAAGGVVLASATEPAPPALHPADNNTQLEAALGRLAELGVAQHGLQPWGTEGQLYRFSCSAAWGDVPGYSRHFEAVAAEPLAAVEQVVDQVAAWRSAEQDAKGFR